MPQIQADDEDKSIADIFTAIYNRLNRGNVAKISKANEDGWHAAMNLGASGQGEARMFFDATVLSAITSLTDQDKKNIFATLLKCAQQRTNSGDALPAIDPDKFRVAPEFGCVVAIDQSGEILVCALHTDGSMETDDVDAINWCVADMPEPEFAKYVLREFSLPKNHFYNVLAKDRAPDDGGFTP